MYKRIIALVLAIGISLILPITGAWAATTAVVTVVMQPDISGGISGFTITYVTDTHMHLDWTLTGEAVNIMVRAKYGEYPDDIPDVDTAPSDGYLVYYGSGSEADDTSMNFDENAGALYYSAWAQKADGTWFLDTSTGWEESKVMTFIGLIVLAGILSYFALKYPNVLLAILGGGAWAALIPYLVSSPPAAIPAGSQAQQMVIIILSGCAMGIFVTTLWRMLSNRREMKAQVRFYKEGGNGTPPKNYRAFIEAKQSDGDEPRESEQDYRGRVRSARSKYNRPNIY